LFDRNEDWFMEMQGMLELDKLGGHDHQIKHCAVDSLSCGTAEPALNETRREEDEGLVAQIRRRHGASSHEAMELRF
jgi:hypothetical protein